jgi:hypothetical protein
MPLFLKHLLFLSALFFISSCAPNKTLYGTWIMDPSPSENATIKLTINKKKYTFYLNDKETVSRAYTFRKGTIISEVIPMANTRDSIPVTKVTTDTLTLLLKEMGARKERTFIRVD